MSLHVYQNGVEIVSQAFIENLVIEESADRGTIATWSFPVDDPAGTQSLTAHYPITVIESASLFGPTVAYGFLTQRSVARSDTSLTSNARAWSPTIVDLNAILGFKVIRTQTFHHKRPAETDLDRVHWLLLSSASGVGVLPQLHGNVTMPSTGGVSMTANDYAGQFPGDVLNDCSSASGRTYFVYYDQTNGPSLFYHKPSNSALTSGISVSNYPGEANNSTVFAPFGDAELRLDPSHFYSGVYMPYSGGSVYALTTGRTIARDVVAPTANTHSRAAALARANRLLADYQNEEGTLTFTIRVPNTHINAVIAGQRILVKFSHLPAFSIATYVRVSHRTIKPAAGTNLTSFDITLECVDPIMTKQGSAPVNSTVWPSAQQPFVPSAAGSFAFVQAAKTANGSLALPTATYAGTPTSGNHLVALLLMQQPGAGSPLPTDFSATFPDGWAVDVGPVGTSLDGRLNAMWVAHKTAGASEPTTVAPVITTIATGYPLNPGFVVLGEYSTGGGTVTVDQSNDGTLTGPSNTGTFTTVTPSSGNATLIVQCLAHEPDYTSTPSAGWTSRSEFLSLGGPRQALSLTDQIIASASTSYGGNATVPGIGESEWYIPNVVYQLVADVPLEGQPVTTDASITTSGSAVTTTYPYATKSLLVTVNGIVQNVTETDPNAGAFDLGFVPRAGVDVVNVRYVAVAASTATPGN